MAKTVKSSFPHDLYVTIEGYKSDEIIYASRTIDETVEVNETKFVGVYKLVKVVKASSKVTVEQNDVNP